MQEIGFRELLWGIDVGSSAYCGGRQHSLARVLDYICGETELNTNIHCSLLPDCGYDGTICFKFLPLDFLAMLDYTLVL